MFDSDAELISEAIKAGLAEETAVTKEAADHSDFIYEAISFGLNNPAVTEKLASIFEEEQEEPVTGTQNIIQQMRERAAQR